VSWSYTFPWEGMLSSGYSVKEIFKISPAVSPPGMLHMRGQLIPPLPRLPRMPGAGSNPSALQGMLA